MYEVGTRVMVKRPSGELLAGVITKVNGPKTRQVKFDAGFMDWNVKLSAMTEI